MFPPRERNKKTNCFISATCELLIALKYNSLSLINTKHHNKFMHLATRILQNLFMNMVIALNSNFRSCPK